MYQHYPLTPFLVGSVPHRNIGSYFVTFQPQKQLSFFSHTKYSLSQPFMWSFCKCEPSFSNGWSDFYTVSQIKIKPLTFGNKIYAFSPFQFKRSILTTLVKLSFVATRKWQEISRIQVVRVTGIVGFHGSEDEEQD